MSVGASSERGAIAWIAVASLLGASFVAVLVGAISLPHAAPARAYVALVGGSAAMTVPLAIGLYAIAQTNSRASLGVIVFGVWLAIGPLSVLGNVLEAHTHHRPLAAATYAVLALAVTIGGIAVSTRLIALAGASQPDASRRVARATSMLFALTSGLLLFIGLRRSIEEPVVGRALLDAVVVVTAAAFSARVRYRRRLPGAVPLLAWAAVVASGAQALSDPAIAAVAADRAPLLLGPLWMFV